MNYATNIALVDKATGTVSNVIWGMIYQQEEFETDTTQAVIIESLPVQIGDSYDGTDFWRDGEKVVAEVDTLVALDAAYTEGVNSI